MLFAIIQLAGTFFRPLFLSTTGQFCGRPIFQERCGALGSFDLAFPPRVFVDLRSRDNLFSLKTCLQVAQKNLAGCASPSLCDVL